MDRTEARKKIDEIDKEIVRLFSERMDVAAAIAQWKVENNMPVLDPVRERAKLQAVTDMSPEHVKPYTPLLYSMMFELSRGYQNKLIGTNTELSDAIQNSIETTEKMIPSGASVVCQGVPGANSQTACDRVFKDARITFVKNFKDVFKAIEDGTCRYGVIPVENSTAGTVNAVYDLMISNNFKIIKSIRVKIYHDLMVNKGAKLEDIKEIYSHEQAINQCRGFLNTLDGVKIIPCENTAIAAKMVAESGRTDIAAISAPACRKIYGLECLKESIQDREDNTTRFICISKDLEIYPGADRTSLMATLPHEAGALYKLLAKIYSYGINLIKLESRRIPNKPEEFMFYFDIDCSVYDPNFLQLMRELPSACDKFNYLGSYVEVI